MEEVEKLKKQRQSTRAALSRISTFCINESAGADEKSPLLLCHTDSLLDKLLPTNWSGYVYTSEHVQAEDIKQRFKMPSSSYSTVKLKSYDTFKVLLWNGLSLQLTTVPVDNKNEHFMFLIQDQHVNSILIDNFTSAAFDVLIRYKFLRKLVLEDKIDVVYINDAVYKQPPPASSSYPSELLLRSLVTLLRPHFVQGIWSAQLPQYLMQDCYKEYN